MKTGQCLGLSWKSVCTELKYGMFVAQVLRNLIKKKEIDGRKQEW